MASRYTEALSSLGTWPLPRVYRRHRVLAVRCLCCDWARRLPAGGYRGRRGAVRGRQIVGARAGTDAVVGVAQRPVGRRRVPGWAGGAPGICGVPPPGGAPEASAPARHGPSGATGGFAAGRARSARSSRRGRTSRAPLVGRTAGEEKDRRSPSGVGAALGQCAPCAGGRFEADGQGGVRRGQASRPSLSNTRLALAFSHFGPPPSRAGARADHAAERAGISPRHPGRRPVPGIVEAGGPWPQKGGAGEGAAPGGVEISDVRRLSPGAYGSIAKTEYEGRASRCTGRFAIGGPRSASPSGTRRAGGDLPKAPRDYNAHHERRRAREMGRGLVTESAFGKVLVAARQGAGGGRAKQISPRDPGRDGPGLRHGPGAHSGTRARPSAPLDRMGGRATH